MSKNLTPWDDLKASLKDTSISPKEKVKRLAGAKGMSLPALAQILNYPYMTLYKILDGKLINPVLFRVRQNQIAEALGVSVTDIWPEYKDAA